MLVIANVCLVLCLRWREAHWNVKYSADIAEASSLLVYYDRSFNENSTWPENVEDWPGISFLHLVSTNVVDGRKVHTYSSDFGGRRIEIRESIRGSPYLSVEFEN